MRESTARKGGSYRDQNMPEDVRNGIQAVALDMWDACTTLCGSRLTVVDQPSNKYNSDRLSER